MSQVIEQFLKRNLRQIFAERDGKKRRAAIDALWTSDAVFSDPHGSHIGPQALDESIAALQSRFPDYVFAHTSEPQVLEDAGRLSWSFGPPEDPERITGLDVVIVRENKIADLYAFIDTPRTEAG